MDPDPDLYLQTGLPSLLLIFYFMVTGPCSAGFTSALMRLSIQIVDMGTASASSSKECCMFRSYLWNTFSHRCVFAYSYISMFQFILCKFD